MTFTLPDAVLNAINKLNTSGYEAYVVGGCVRDYLMGNTPQDWDIATSATPTQMQAVFADEQTITTGLKHGTLTVLFDHLPLEITTYRVDGDYSDGRHPNYVAFTTSLREDLQRRDFTMNAIAYHPSLGFVDLFDGQEDIATKTIRCVGVPTERFAEDALRILRALRFASVLGFAIDEETSTAIHALAPTLTRVSAERISLELQKLLCGIHVESVLRHYPHTVAVFLPEVHDCSDFHLLPLVPNNVRTRLAALFYGADVSIDVAKTSLRNLRMDNKTIDEVSLLLKQLPKSTYTEDAYLLRLLNLVGSNLIFDYLAIREADEATILRVHQLLDEGICYNLAMLTIDGNDLISAGISPGPNIGNILDELLDAVMDGCCENTRGALLEYVQQII